MLGVEVFRDKQGQGHKQRNGEDEGKEETVDEMEKVAGELDTENGENNTASAPKLDSSNVGSSSWEF